MTTKKYDEALSQNPGRIIVVHCHTCDFDYDVREVTDEVQHTHALHVMAFTCPKGHRDENRRLWKDSQEQEQSELARLNAEVRADLEKSARVATTEPELGRGRCPNGHDSSLPPRLPELIFETCGHYSTEATWNEFCITCGIRHAAFRIYWRGYEGRFGSRVNSPKNYCGYCGAKMSSVGA